GVMAGAFEICVLFIKLVARKAALGDVFAFGILENKNLALVASGIYVRFARAVAGFAPLPLRALLGQGGSKVAGRLEIFEDVFVTGFTGFRANVLRCIGRSTGRECSLWLGLLASPSRSNQHDQRQDAKS